MTEATHHPKILVVAGSSRLDSLHRKLARQTVEALRNAGVEATLADLRDFPMPIYDGDLEAGEGLPTAAKALKELARRHDGFYEIASLSTQYHLARKVPGDGELYQWEPARKAEANSGGRRLADLELQVG